MPTGVYNTAWVEYVSAVLKKHGASLRSQRQRTGLSHTTVSSWLQGVKPGLEGARAFINGFEEDETDGLRAAGYALAAPDLSRLSFGQHDSPQNRYETTVNALYVKYTGLQWERVPHPQLERHFSGGEVKDERQADLLLAAWLEELGKRNPGKPAPEELAEYEERLAGG